MEMSTKENYLYVSYLFINIVNMYLHIKDFAEPIIKSIKNIYKLLRRRYKTLLRRTYLK